MNRRFCFTLTGLTLIIAILSNAPGVRGCGPFALEAIFVFTVHPEYPLENFARGDLGVVQPTFARSYLYVAYRHLSGTGFNEAEQKQLAELWKDRLEYTWDLGEQDWIKEWTTARAKVPGLTAVPQIDVYRHREKPNEYETYLNCQKDAFSTATATLEARIKTLGADNGQVKEWVEAQDEVFANCSEGQHIPKPTASTDALMCFDRDYQTAAANFYAGNFDTAKEAFSTISANSASPWSSQAPYLVARTLVRKASLGPAESKDASLTDAETQLKNILSSQKLAPLHEASERLLSLVRLRLHPQTRLSELAKSLMVKNRGEQIKQDLWDYTVLLDQFMGDEESENKTAPPREIFADDLTDWILTFASSNKSESLNHSFSKWQSTRSVPWLIAVLSRIKNENANIDSVRSEAEKITPESPAYPSVVFQLARLDIESGKYDEARRRIDESLTRYRSRLNGTSSNLLLNLRMALAVNLEDFLVYAQRLPAGFSWNDDGREVPENLKNSEEPNRALEGQKLFDSDAARTLNERMPLSVLKQAALNKTLPQNLKRDLVQAVWLRAVLLGDYKTANELVPAVNSLVPNMSSLLEASNQASLPEAKKFSAIYAWLKFPGLEPIVDAGIGRQTPLGEQDAYRDNWWCGSAFQPGSAVDGSESKEKAKSAGVTTDASKFPIFLTAAERTSAAKEFATLSSLGAAPNYLCKQVVQWATQNPEDPRVPEALHLAVKTTRYGCTNKETGRWSKAAYDLLHKRYPTTTWAKQTPYWFKD